MAGRVLLVKTGEGELKVTIPEKAQLTFGPTVPYAKNNNGYHDRQGYSLRVYEDKAKDSLIAVFSDVHWFRDMAIPVAKLVVREAGKSVWRSDEQGYEVQESRKFERNFVALPDGTKKTKVKK